MTKDKKCENCIFFELRRGTYDGGHEQGYCLKRRWYVYLFDLCNNFVKTR